MSSRGKYHVKGTLPQYDEDGVRIPDEVWRFRRLQVWMKAMKLQLEGLTVKEISLQMGVSLRSVYNYLEKGSNAIESGKISDTMIMELGQISEPVQVQRMRLMGRLRKSDEVIGKSMEDYDKNVKYARNATKTALALNKGLGVLVDTAIVGVGEIDVLAKRREDQQARLEAMKQFGVKVEAEVVDSDGIPVNAARETGDDN